MSGRMRRRDFLRLAGVGVAAGLAAAGVAASSSDDDLAHPALLDALDADAVRALGARYREMAPGEADAAGIRAAIAAARSRSGTVAAAVHADFEHGRTVVVDGWILSATEARQCALLSLLPG
jgi:hypothetical protein